MSAIRSGAKIMIFCGNRGGRRAVGVLLGLTRLHIVTKKGHFK